MIWSETQKAEMLRLKDVEDLEHAEIADHFGITGKKRGDIIRKVLARYRKAPAKPAPAAPAVAKARARQEGGEIGRLAGNRPAALPARLRAESPVKDGVKDSLARLHDKFDAKVPGRSSSRPKWAGPRPLAIMPKNFQRSYYNPEQEPEDERAVEKLDEDIA